MTAAENTMPSELVLPVMDELAELFEQVAPDSYGDPTPCPGYTVGEMRDHVLAWVTYFSAALADPEGQAERPDPAAITAPPDPAEAAAAVRTQAERMGRSVAAGAPSGQVLMVNSTMDGQLVLGMALGEFVAHGWDLASGAGRPWAPPEAAAEAALGTLSGMLTDEYRGEDKSFGPRVEVPGDAPALDRLLGFAGRDPHWKRPAS